jgi:arylsulfatase
VLSSADFMVAQRIPKLSRNSATFHLGFVSGGNHDRVQNPQTYRFWLGGRGRKNWFYFTENELTPGAARAGNYKAVFNLRGDDGVKTGGLAVDSNLGWKGAEAYVATVPQVFDLWQDSQERYDIFMNNYTERTWVMIAISDAIKELMKTYIKYPPRKLQSQSYSGPVTLTSFERFQFIRDQLAKEGVTIALPTGN